MYGSLLSPSRIATYYNRLTYLLGYLQVCGPVDDADPDQMGCEVHQLVDCGDLVVAVNLAEITT